VNDESLQALGSMKALLDLDLNGARIAGPGLTALKGCTNLTFLSLANTQVSDAHLAALAPLRNLTRLHLGNTRVKGPGLSQLSGLGKLAFLALEALNLEANAFDALSRSKSLSGLDLNASKLETTHLDRIGLMSGLEALNFANATVGGRPLADCDLSRLAGLTKLRNLNVSFTAVTGTGFTALSRARNLDSLVVEDTTALTDEGLLAAIRTFPALTQIFVGGKVTENSLAALSQLKKLKLLRLNGPNISDAGISALPALRTLEALELNAPRATTACAAALTRQPALTRLSIHNTALNDDAVPHLVKIKTLRELHLGTAPISTAGLEALRKALPTCTITK
jgi:Leucine-rich repeat (LRR) protein